MLSNLHIFFVQILQPPFELNIIIIVILQIGKQGLVKLSSSRSSKWHIHTDLFNPMTPVLLQVTVNTITSNVESLLCARHYFKHVTYFFNYFNSY